MLILSFTDDTRIEAVSWDGLIIELGMVAKGPNEIDSLSVEGSAVAAVPPRFLTMALRASGSNGRVIWTNSKAVRDVLT